MAVRVKRYTANANIVQNPVFTEVSQDARETTVDGYTFHWGTNEVRNFLDDGVGIAHAAFGAQGVRQDIIPFNNARS